MLQLLFVGPMEPATKRGFSLRLYYHLLRKISTVIFLKATSKNRLKTVLFFLFLERKRKKRTKRKKKNFNKNVINETKSFRQSVDKSLNLQ